MARHSREKTRLGFTRLEDRLTPGFAGPVSYAAGAFAANAAVADFNHDGRADLAVVNSWANSSANSVSVLLGNGNGTFQSPISAATAESPEYLSVGDFNGDGNPDLVTNHYIWNPGYQTVSILFGNGNGTFQPVSVQSLPISGDGGNYNGAGAGDVNNDGFADIVALSGMYPDPPVECTVLLGSSSGAFTPVYQIFTAYPYYSSLKLADFNEDGNLDLCAGMTINLGNGDGTFQDDLIYHQTPAIGDFNNDGHLDSSGGYPAGVSVNIGDGTGGISMSVGLNSGFEAGAVSAGDVNGDGAIDIIALNNQPGTTVVLGNANHSFGPYFNSSEAAGLSSIAVGDFNGDGKSDLAATDSAAGVVKVFLNNGIWIGGTPLPVPSIAIADVTMTEGNTGTQTASFTVTLSASWYQSVSVQFLTANGSAASGSDYQSTGGTVSFAAGETARTLSVSVIGDRLAESNETFVVNLSNPTNATIADSQGLGTITDDEPRIAISDVSQSEGKKGHTSFTFTVTLSAAYDQAVTVSFGTANGTATTSDYTAQSGSRTFSTGQTQKTITIVVNGDKKKESDETFFVNLSGNSSNSLLLDGQGLGTILNDD